MNPTRMCELLVGLPEVNVLGVEAWLQVRVKIESRLDQGWCPRCGARAAVKDRPVVTLVDLPCFGRPTRLLWRKHRWVCREQQCPMGSWTIVDERIALPRATLTDRASRWVTRQVGELARSVKEVAKELGCDWHTVNDAVVTYGEALLEADTRRVGTVSALGLDETLFNRYGRWRTQVWCTSVVDVGGPGHQAKLIEVIEGRTAAAVSEWIDKQPEIWRGAIRYGV